MRRLILAAAAATLATAAPAAAKCSDEIKALQGAAASSDAARSPGSQAETSAPGTMPKEGGGERSASAKVLEAQAHDQRGDEAACMKAVDEAKKEMK
jgi:hypothetical protein